MLRIFLEIFGSSEMNIINENTMISLTLTDGHLGVGKNMTLLQTIHYAYINKWCIIQTPWRKYWLIFLI